MAFELTEIQACSNDMLANKFKEKGPTNIWVEGDPLAYKLLGNGSMERDFIIPGADLVEEGGDRIRAPLLYAEANSGSYGEGTIVTTARKTIVNAARFPVGGIYASDAIGLKDQESAEGDIALVNLVQTKLDNIIRTCKHRLAVALFGTGTVAEEDIYGLGNLFSTVTATAYGGIAEDDMALWAANVDTTAEAISFAALQNMRALAEVGSGNATGIPNLYLGPRIMVDGYERTLQTQQQFRDDVLGAAGFHNLLFSGVPFVVDPNVASGTVYGLNLEFLKFKARKSWAFTKPVWEHEVGTPDKHTANTRLRGQLVCYNRRAHVKHTNLTLPA